MQQAAPLAFLKNTSDPDKYTLFEACFRCIAVFLAGLVLVCALAKDFRARMWIDELYTLYEARQANAAEIAKATLEGCDAAPPLYAIIVHTILPWSAMMRSRCACHPQSAFA
jgi:hypothetical protein